MLDAFRSLCASRWGFRYRSDDGFTLRDFVERAYQASDAPSMPAFAELLGSLADTDPEVQAFVGRMVVGETSFFRNQPQFEALSSRILPELIAARRRSGDLKLRVWSAGCASGEEPYSLAILLATLIEDWKSWDIAIRATDLNPFALRRASDAMYSDWSFREADPRIVGKFFTRVGRLRRLDHACRSLVRFRRHNLATDAIPDAGQGLCDLDLILCRNVTIYFDRGLTERLADAFYASLQPGGWLVVGHTEPDITVYRRFETHEFPDAIVYRRPLEETDVRAVISEPELEPAVVPVARASLGAPSPDASLDDALHAYEAHDLASAFELLCDVSKRSPTDPLPAHLLAQISADEKRYDESLYWAFTALQCDAFHVPTLLLMGLVFLERGDATRARDHFSQAAFLAPTSRAAHLYLSMAHRRLGCDDLALRSSERAARLTFEPTDKSRRPLPVELARLAVENPGESVP